MIGLGSLHEPPGQTFAKAELRAKFLDPVRRPFHEEELIGRGLDNWDRAELIDRLPFRDGYSGSAQLLTRFRNDYLHQKKPVVVAGMYADNPLTEGVADRDWGWEVRLENSETRRREDLRPNLTNVFTGL